MDNMVATSIIGVYNNPYYSDVCIVEMLIDERPDMIDFSLFYCIDRCLPKSDWQTAFGEHFLSVDGEAVIGDGINKPDGSDNVSRVVFGLYAEALGLPLSTPYGQFTLPPPMSLPYRLNDVVLNIYID